MGFRIAHFGDTHIRNISRHDEYREIFRDIRERLRALDVDLIVHCGDLSDSGTNLSPEYFVMARLFFEILLENAPVIVIPGNHDGNERNRNRIDAIAPVAHSFEEECRDGSLFYSPNSFSVSRVHEGKEFCFHHYSIFDDDWRGVSPKDGAINIALYHGLISGASNDLGYQLVGKNSGEFLIGHDFAFLGDIHKTNQIILGDPRKRYCGSTIQQNHGELDDKGFLIWDIRGRDDYDVEHVLIKNPQPYHTIEVDKDEYLHRGFPDIPDNARLKIKASGFGAGGLAELRAEAGSLRACSVSVLADVQSHEATAIKNVGSQREAILAWLVDNDVAEEMASSVMEKWQSIGGERDVSEVSIWTPKRLKWENLYRYGAGNEIDFDSLEPGLIGIFGPNRAGKSSVVDTLFFALYGTSTKNNRRLSYILNKFSNHGSVEFEAVLGGSHYRIVRKLKRTNRSVSMSAEVYRDGETITAKSRTKTEKLIRSIFGEQEDFLIAAFSSQFDALAFIDEGSTKRKEILARFLNLQSFEGQYKRVNDEKKSLKSQLKMFSDFNPSEEKAGLEDELQECVALLGEMRSELGRLSGQIESQHEIVLGLRASVGEGPTRADLEGEKASLVRALARDRRRFSDVKQEEASLEAKIEGLEVKIGEYDELIEGLDGGTWREDLRSAEEACAEVKKDQNLLENRSLELRMLQKNSSGALNRPCGDKFLSTCSFLTSIRDTEREMERLSSEVQEIRRKIEENEEVISSIDRKTLKKREEGLRKVKSLKKEAEYDLRIAQRDLSTAVAMCNSIEESLKGAEAELKSVERRIEGVEEDDTLERLEAAEGEYNRLKSSSVKLEKEIGHLTGREAVCRQKLKDLEAKRRRFEILSHKLSVADLLSRALHSNGAPFMVVKSNLQAINQVIKSLLVTMESYEITFEAEGDKLEIYLDDGGGKMPLEAIGSGAERMMAAMAIRMSLTSISQITSGDIYILDEPATALDAETTKVFLDMMEHVCDFAKHVLVISHIPQIKDCVSRAISISVGEKFSKCSPT